MEYDIPPCFTDQKYLCISLLYVKILLKVAAAREREKKTWLILMIHSKDMRLCTHASVCLLMLRETTEKG